jgi:hypothetical protein
MNRSAQNKAAKRAQQTSAKDFAFFADPLLKFGEESGRYGQEYMDYAREGRGKTEDLYARVLESLGEDTFNKMSTAHLETSLRGAQPQLQSILGAVGGAGFNPANTGRGSRQVGGLYGQILGEHGRYQTGLQRQLALDRQGIGDRYEAMRRSDLEAGVGFRGEKAGIMEAMLTGAPPGSSEYFSSGKSGMSVNKNPYGQVERRGVSAGGVPWRGSPTSGGIWGRIKGGMRGLQGRSI